MLLFFHLVKEKDTDLLRLCGEHLEDINFSEHNVWLTCFFRVGGNRHPYANSASGSHGASKEAVIVSPGKMIG